MKYNLAAVLIAAVALAALTSRAPASDSTRQTQVEHKSERVMPFSMDATMHQFVPTPAGALQKVMVHDGNPKQVLLVRAHLRKEAAAFARGDFADPASIHGGDMPGLAAMHAGAKRIRVRYAEVPDGATITYTTADPALVTALHAWFHAQVTDHGKHATMSSAATANDLAVPRYAHVFVIVEENKDYAQIIDSANAPVITRLAKTYGAATNFFGEVHPSQANYIALVGGDTFGIHDDDPFFCQPHVYNPECSHVEKDAAYANHTVDAPHLGTQLDAAGLSWRGYYEDIPAPGSLVPFATAPGGESDGALAALYAAKHSAFLNFRATQLDPRRAEHLVGFDRLDADLASGNLPAFALVVPNQCNEMHGGLGKSIPADCSFADMSALIQRGDAMVDRMVRKIQASPAWAKPDNVAIVVTWDEDSGNKAGCCGSDPASAANFGGGHIATVVITNHGPRGVADPTPYNHYSLLRTLEDAFGIRTYLRHANDTAKGVIPMLPLFRR